MYNLGKHTEILRGKDATNNKRIMKILAEKKDPMNVAGITKTLMPNWEHQYRQYVSFNAVIYRRVQALAKMGYLMKSENNEYSLSLKAYLLACILFPEITRSIPIILKGNKKPKVMGFELTEEFLTQTLADFMLVRPFEKLLGQGKINLDVISDEELIQLINELGKETALTVRDSADEKEVSLKDMDIFIDWLESEKTKLDKMLAVAKEFRETKQKK